MKKRIFFLALIVLAALAAACGDDAPKKDAQSADDKALTQAVSGPFTEAEFKKFLADLPSVPGLSAHSQTAATGGVLSDQVKSAIKACGWDEDRFTYIYGHAVSMLGLDQVERTRGEMEKQLANMPEDQRKMMRQTMGGEMDRQCQAIRADVDKMVPAGEQAIVRGHMAALRSALGMPAE
ncbi:hypothetical protein [Pseudodesulfovibrio sp.]|uniref:hypothetical protein n=1 Tax=Pseudodesulfovibrio sp. TaxID=2035812 RepID=UPI002612DCCB|nr:hypothetical protein [Pseudodesulfovibrio sp.]MDD3312983.1 hypothetical protein [Pseudodesulfovibrio sp.]